MQVTGNFDQYDLRPALASSKEAPRQRGVCVNHLKRCKTSKIAMFQFIRSLFVLSDCYLHRFPNFSSMASRLRPASSASSSAPSLSHTLLKTQLCHAPSFTHNFVTHHLSHTTLSHTLFHTQFCHTPSFTHNFVTHTLFHTQLCHTPSFTHNFVTHSLSHKILSHTLFHTQLCHTQSFTHNFVTYTLLSDTLFHTQLCHTLS